MIRRLTAGTFATTILLGAASCGGGGGSGGGSSVVAPPTAPSVPSPQPPTVAVGFTDQLVGWSGRASYTEGGMSDWRLTVKQNGPHVSGDVQTFGKAGPFAGTASGNTLTFSFSVGNGGQECGNAITGTATVSLTTMTGTMSGHDCQGNPVTNGTMTSALEGASSSPGIIPGMLTSAPYTVAGTWSSLVDPSLGGGNWTWVLSDEQGDVFQRTFSGSVSVTANNTLHLGSASVTGTRTEAFPFLPTTGRERFSATFGGACPTTVQWVTTFDPGDLAGNTLQGNVTGTSCNGNFNGVLQVGQAVAAPGNGSLTGQHGGRVDRGSPSSAPSRSETVRARLS